MNYYLVCVYAIIIYIVDICCGTGSIGLTMAKVWNGHTHVRTHKVEKLMRL